MPPGTITTTTPVYDPDGNLTDGSSFHYAWDAEHRLVSAEPLNPASGLKMVTFAYDYLSRRIQKTSYTYTGSDWTLDTTTTFVYDGWNVMQETTTTGGSASTVQYVWGLDLSGSLHGAGGIGGLLLRSTDTGTFQYLYDANGNVGQLVNVADGSLAARYEYDPFGNTLVADGPEAERNPYRYSTKYFMPEIGWYDYGRRPYDPVTGRWPTRDPIGENGGVNLYGFIRNNAINFYDFLGLTTVAEIMEAFFSNSTMERTWYMNENDEYTIRMRQLKVVKNRLNELKSHLGNNCEAWENNHKTTPSWEPTQTDPPIPDPNAYGDGKEKGDWFPNALGENPLTMLDSPFADSKANPWHTEGSWKEYQRTKVIPEDLWYEAIGGFGMYVTVDKIDCCKKTATLRVWLYNSMDKDSGGRFRMWWYGVLTPGSQGKMARQYMWWTWAEEYSWE